MRFSVWRFCPISVLGGFSVGNIITIIEDRRRCAGLAISKDPDESVETISIDFFSVCFATEFGYTIRVIGRSRTFMERVVENVYHNNTTRSNENGTREWGKRCITLFVFEIFGTPGRIIGPELRIGYYY